MTAIANAADSCSLESDKCTVRSDTAAHAIARRFSDGVGTRAMAVTITLGVVVLAAALGEKMWDAYMGSPWTRDATVRAYVVDIAPEVAGRIVEMNVVDNQYVHKNDVLMSIDPTNYRIAVEMAEAAVKQAEANALNARREADRRSKLNDLAISIEQKQAYEAVALASEAQLQQAHANLDQARANLDRTVIRSPVNGHVTNLLVQRGDFAQAGASKIAIVDADSFWVDAYFEESNLDKIGVGDEALIKLMSFSDHIVGKVGSIARGISVANAQPSQQGLANVNPIFTWVRLAQRIPVRLEIDKVPDNVTLVAGMTATVQIEHAAPAR